MILKLENQFEWLLKAPNAVPWSHSFDLHVCIVAIKLVSRQE